MAKTYRVGVACMSHDHVWGELQHWQQMETWNWWRAATTSRICWKN